jgi:hypothetical protein
VDLDGDSWITEESRYNEDTNFKVQKGLLKSGLDMQQAFDAIREMQNEGILFRERMP